MDPSLKVSLMGHCVICLRKVRDGVNDDDGKGVEKFNVGEGDVQKFSRTFNEFWTILKAKGHQNSGNSSETCGVAGGGGISLTTAISSVGQGATTYFSVAPTLCQLCGGKVVAVENLMKAVRQQVREVEMLLVKSRRKGGGRLKEFEKYLRENGMAEGVIQSTVQFVNISGQCQGQDQGQPIEDKGGSDEMQVKEEAPSLSWNWQEPAPEPVVGSQANSELTADATPVGDQSMECDEGISKFLDNDTNEGDEDSNWGWGDDDDPDYIKSEQEDDDENEEETNDEDEEEEIPLEDMEVPSTSSGIRIGVTTNPPDPLALTTYKCPFENCDKLFTNSAALEAHKDKYHRPPPPDKEKNIICEFPNCGRTFATKSGYTNHKEKTHRDPNSQKFACSCGRSFPTEVRRYDHQRRQKNLHPEFKPRIASSLILSGRGQQCDMCGEMVEFSKIFKHLRVHVGSEYVIKCPNSRECRYMFSNMRELMYHFIKVKGKNCKEIGREMKSGLTCEACGFTGNNAQVLRTHLTDQHERDAREKKIKCPISGCGKMFCLKQSVKCHLHVHQNKKITKQNCDKCGEGVEIGGMEEHLKGKHGVGEVIGCGQCEMKFSGRDEMVEHLWEHRFAGLTCDICGDDKPVKYLKYSDFREHYFGEHKLCPKRYKCGEGNCGVMVWRKNDLGRHRHDEETGAVLPQDVKKKILRCELCFEETTYTTETAMLSHKIKVHGAEPFTCDICGEAFHDKHRFSKHRKEHAGVVVQKEWKCEVEGCGRIFNAKKSLKGHTLNMHGGEKKHVCGDCGKGFAFPQGLKTHRDSVHLGLRPWVCDECGESFTASTTLKKHKMIHTGERPFACEICGQRFRFKEVLKTHVRGHEEKGAGFKPNGPMKQIRKRKAQ